MNQQAIVSTRGDTLNVRAAPNGSVIDTLDNETVVEVIGSPVEAGGFTWVAIGSDRWVAREFLSVYTPEAEGDPDPGDTIPGPKVVATQTEEAIAGGLKVYRTRLIDGEGWIVDTVRCVSGRIGLQVPSEYPGSQTPIPFGIYRFDRPGSVGAAPGEFGGVWSAVTPTFETYRGGFGIHYDPSAFANTDQTGTAGCLATPTVGEREIMTNFILAHAPTHLIVQKGDDFVTTAETR